MWSNQAGFRISLPARGVPGEAKKGTAQISLKWYNLVNPVKLHYDVRIDIQSSIKDVMRGG